MKTSSISLRVADFLKQYPPFQFMSQADILFLADHGRVKFHEEDEIIYRKGEQRSKYVYVIQQGTVRLLDTKENGEEEIVDIRVEGDMLGVFWSMVNETYLYTAKTEGDTILYALIWDDIVRAAKRNPKVVRYLAAYFSLHPGHELPNTESVNFPKALAENDQLWLKASGPINAEATRQLLTCTKEEPIREVASRMGPGHQEAVVVVDDRWRPIGIVTETDLISKVATGRVSVDEPVEKIMTSPVITVPPDMSVGPLLTCMLRHRLRHLCVTVDGTPRGPIIGVVAERDLQLLHGRLPTYLTKEILRAKDGERLGRLRDRADELLLYYLDNEVPANWLADFVTEIDGAVVERAIQLAIAQLESRGLRLPPVSFCWMAFHSEGRRERFLRSAQRTGLIYEDPSPDQADAVRTYFHRLASEVTFILTQTGLPLDPREEMANQSKWCQPVSVWKEYYSQWIEHPVESNILLRTPFFDLRPVWGNTDLVRMLHQHIHEKLSANPHFIPLLANDAMANLPPMTIFRDSVMDQAGVLWTQVDTKSHVLLPLVDMARVFALQYGLFTHTATMDRYQRIAELMPEQKRLFEEAAEMTRFALSLQTQFGLRRGDNGQFIKPAEISLIDRERLKNVFRLIAKLMEFSAGHFKLKEEVLYTEGGLVTRKSNPVH